MHLTRHTHMALHLVFQLGLAANIQLPKRNQYQRMLCEITLRGKLVDSLARELGIFAEEI